MSNSASSATREGELDAESVNLLNVRKPANLPELLKRPNWFVRGFRSVFGYRKTTLTFLVFVVLLATVAQSYVDNNLNLSVPLPSNKLEKKILDKSWLDLQEIGREEHTYTSSGNDYVHDYLQKRIEGLVGKLEYAEFDNDLDYSNKVMFPVKYLTYNSVSYYESNNLLVRINGTSSELPALLLSAHYDSVPSSFGITDDGMGIASMLGLLEYFVKAKQPERTIIFNFNNNEEFGLYGANAFLSHPWFGQIKYFLNLEGTGAGGKAVLFRGTDYGILKHWSSVRYPYATSLFQQGFNNRLIHSETDYAVYKDKGGIRGLDLAFFKPRDLYHTAGDNIKNIDILALWHMLSNALDFTKHMSGEIDLDEEYLTEAGVLSHEFGAYTSVWRYFIAFPISQVVLLNIVFLVLIPLICLPLILIISNYKRNWDVNFVNLIKFPLSIGISVVVLNLVTDTIIVPSNTYLANNSTATLVFTLFAGFLLLNYLILNGLNVVFKPFKGHNHDEKLIVIIETSFLAWLALLWSTVKLSHNRIGDDHTGEFLIVVLFLLQAVASFFGLLGWVFKSSSKNVALTEDSRPLLAGRSQTYGVHEDEEFINDSSSLSLHSSFLGECSDHDKRLFSYDWLLQFLIIVPLSSFIIYNEGSLVLYGVNKSIQESLAAQNFIYKLVQAVAIVWAVPFLPFIFKLNRIIVLALLFVLFQGIIVIAFKSPFDDSNPLKLRFIETINLNSSPFTNTVQVTGRLMPLVEDILEDMPSFKLSHQKLSEFNAGDGVLYYSFESPLLPKLIPGVKSFDDYLSIEVLKDSSSETDSPFGLLSGEIKIVVPKNRNCRIDFNVSDTIVKLYGDVSSAAPRSPVQTVIVYADKKVGNSSTPSYSAQGVPSGFSKDKAGNYLYKDFEGISQLQLNKLDWDKLYHVGFQWVPDVVEMSEVEVEKINVKKLGVNIECFWSELGYLAEKHSKEGATEERIPAYGELLHYSPSFTSWANKDRGLVSVTKYIEI